MTGVCPTCEGVGDAAVAAWNMAPDGDPEGAMRAALEASAASAGKDEAQ